MKGSNNIHKPSYFALIAAGEPFRLFFPLGIFIGVLGVMLWPIFAWKLFQTYPGIIHSRIMIEGFISSFVFGFLGTALPRLLGVKRVTGKESVLYFLLVISVCGFHLAQAHLIADVLFLLALGSFVVGLLVRARERQDTPPPGFILVFFGMFSAFVGATIFIGTQLAPHYFSSSVYSLGRLLLNQGYILFPIMGIGAFILPRFLGLPNQQNFPESLQLPPGWMPKALFALACGLVLLASFIVETLGYLQIGFGMRAFAVLLYFWREVPIHRAKFSKGSLAIALRIAMLSIPLGYICMAIWPMRQAAFIHIVFISGFSLITLTVASRVVLGHSGQSEKLALPLKSIYIMMGLILLAMITRVSADWMPDARWSHLGYAALVWAAAAIVWAIFILPGVRTPDAEA